MEIIVIPGSQTPRVTERVDAKRDTPKLDAFLDFASKRKNAVGLAANQVAIDGERFNLNAFAIKSLVTKEWSLVINPEIVEYIGMKEIKHEGCLTWKDQVVIAERSRAVKVKYLTTDGEYHQEVFTGFVGQIWQHEMNHLLGVEEVVVPAIMSGNEPKSDVGRNETCPCGSGKKYKKCCLNLL